MGEDINKNQDIKLSMEDMYKKIIERTSGISVELQDLILGNLYCESDRDSSK